MKIGDQLTVSIENIPVGTATVAEMEGDEVTIRYEGAMVRMKVNMTLTDAGPEPSGTEHIITGTFNPNEETDVNDN